MKKFTISVQDLERDLTREESSALVNTLLRTISETLDIPRISFTYRSNMSVDDLEAATKRNSFTRRKAQDLKEALEKFLEAEDEEPDRRDG